MFGTADFVGDKTVFDIGGNKYRLIAYIHYRAKIVFIKHILTHAEYDKKTWPDDCGCFEPPPKPKKKD